MKFDRSNKQVNLVRLKSSVASKWASKHHWGVSLVLLVMVHIIIETIKYQLKVKLSDYE